MPVLSVLNKMSLDVKINNFVRDISLICFLPTVRPKVDMTW